MDPLIQAEKQRLSRIVLDLEHKIVKWKLGDNKDDLDKWKKDLTSVRSSYAVLAKAYPRKSEETK